MTVFAQDNVAGLQEALRQVYPEAENVTVDEGNGKGGWSGALAISGSPAAYEAHVLGEVTVKGATFVVAWIHFPEEDEHLYDANFVNGQDLGYSPFPARLLVWETAAPEKVHAVALGVGSVFVTNVEPLSVGAEGLEKSIINIRYGTLSALQDPLTQVREVFEAFYSIPGLNHLGTVRLDRVYLSGEMMEADDIKRAVRLVPSADAEEPAVEIEEISDVGTREKRRVGVKSLGREAVTRTWDKAPSGLRAKARKAQPSEGDFHFRVVDEKHQPVEGARIYGDRTKLSLYRWEPPSERFEITTSKTGLFSIQGGGEVKVGFEVHADGFESRGRLYYDWNAPPTGIVDIVLRPLGETVPMLQTKLTHEWKADEEVHGFGMKLRADREFYVYVVDDREAADLWCTVTILGTGPDGRGVRYKLELSGGPGVRLKATGDVGRSYAWEELNKLPEAPIGGYEEHLVFEGPGEATGCIFLEFDGGTRYGKLQPIYWGVGTRGPNIYGQFTANVILQSEATSSRILRVYPTQMPNTKKEAATGAGR
jgi:hypothetical protein